jgi:hypothetical protein
VAHGIHDERFHALKSFDGLWIRLLHVADVSADFPITSREQEAHGVHFAMHDEQRRDLGFTEPKRPHDHMRLRFEIAAIPILSIEGMVIHGFQLGETQRPRINRDHRVLGNAEASQVIEARHMIHVRMGDEHRIQMADVFP